MTKLVWVAVLLVLGCKLFTARWPWELLAGKKRSSAEAQARALLGVRQGAPRDEIIEAHRRRITQVHPDRGGSSELVHEANAARDVLLASASRDLEG